MLLTVQEAHRRLCQETFNSARLKCAGPECMAWRWAENIPQVCVKCGTEDTAWQDDPEQRRGYCGLAGLPKW